ncbi:hypothetical protein HKD37_06G015833 [Glycine soja]
MDQSYGEVCKSFLLNANMHSVTYNQDLVTPTLLVVWIELRDLYGLIGNHQDVPSIIYSFMKDIRFIHLNLEGITECRIVYNHWRKTAKIGNGWKTFAQSQNLQSW